MDSKTLLAVGSGVVAGGLLVHLLSSKSSSAAANNAAGDDEDGEPATTMMGGDKAPSSELKRDGPVARFIASTIPYYPFKGIDRFYDVGGMLMEPDAFECAVRVRGAARP